MSVEVLIEKELMTGENVRMALGVKGIADLSVDWVCRVNVRLESDPSQIFVNRLVTDLNVDNSQFMVNITSLETQSLDPGKSYILGVELSNATVGDSKEARVRLKIYRDWVSET